MPSRDHRHDVDALAAAAREHDARLVWLCDPNNPTGSLVTRDEWERLLAGVPDRCAVVVDEAYVEYVDPAVRLDRRAGRRGRAARSSSCARSRRSSGSPASASATRSSSEPLAEMIDVVLEPFNVNRAALAAGRASLRAHRPRRDPAAGQRGRPRAARRACCARPEPTPYPSQANFLLVDVGVDDVALTEGLARRGFLVRAGSEFGLAGCVRITTGPVPLMERVGRRKWSTCGRNCSPRGRLSA